MQAFFRKFFFAFLFVTGSATLALADGIDFYQGTWAEIQAEAQKSGKPIFVEFYTTWCGPCKMMARDVFANEEVGAYYNTHFLSMKVDAERDEPTLVEEMAITAVPTLAYFAPDGKLLVRQEGALDAEGFIRQGRILVEFDAFEAAYQKDPQDQEAFANYLAALQVRDEDKAAELAGKQLASLDEAGYLNEANWPLIRDFGTDPYSAVYAYLATHPAEALEQFGQPYLGYIQSGLEQLMQEAVEKGDETPLADYNKYFYAVLSELEEEPREKAYYDAATRIGYLEEREDYSTAMAARDTFLHQYHWDDWESLFESAMNASEIPAWKPYLATAETWSQRALELEESSLTLIGYAFLLRAMGKEEAALEKANKAKEINDDERLSGIIEGFFEEEGVD